VRGSSPPQAQPLPPLQHRKIDARSRGASANCAGTELSLALAPDARPGEDAPIGEREPKESRRPSKASDLEHGRGPCRVERSADPRQD